MNRIATIGYGGDQLVPTFGYGLRIFPQNWAAGTLPRQPDVERYYDTLEFDVEAQILHTVVDDYKLYSAVINTVEHQVVLQADVAVAKVEKYDFNVGHNVKIVKDYVVKAKIDHDRLTKVLYFL